MSLQPNILLVVLDTLRSDHLSCYGYQRKTTPSLDRLARNSSLFKQAVSPAQWTIPAHTSMFTGSYAHELGVQQISSKLPTGVGTLAERLKEVGYYTAGFSNNPLVGLLPNGLVRGFDQFYNYGGLLSAGPGLRKSKFPLDRVIPAIQRRSTRSSKLLQLLFSPPINPLWQVALVALGNVKGDPHGSLSDLLRLCRDRPAAKPLFSFINLMGAHIPFYPPRSTWPSFLPKLKMNVMGSFEVWRLNKRLYRLLGALPEPLSPSLQATLIDMYDAEIMAQDQILGEFFTALFQERASENMIIVVVADHGEMLGDDDLFGHAFTAANPLIRVPLVIWDGAARFPAGQIRDEPVSTRRVFHTLCAAGGAATVDEVAGALWNQEPRAPFREVKSVAEPMQWVVDIVERRHPGLIARRGLDRTWIVRYQDSGKVVEIVKNG